jgi:hypothetical protein
MNEVVNTISKSQSTLTLAEVSLMLNYKRDSCTIKWLKKNGVQIHRLTNKNFVYQIELDFVLEKPYVTSLRIKHPQRWKEMYRCVCKDKSLYELMVMEMGESTEFIPMTKVSLKSKSDIKLYNSLLS